MSYSRIYGIIGSLGALAAIGADLVLQYNANPAHLGALDYSYFLDVSQTRIYIGFYLGVIAILIQIAGLWHVRQGLAPAGTRFSLPFFIISGFILALGAVFHAHAALLGLVVKAQSQSVGDAAQVFNTLISDFVSFRVTLIIILFVGLVIYSLWYALVVTFKPTAYPRFLAWFNPLLCLLLFGLLGVLIPVLRYVLLPAGINLAHLLFFVITIRFQRENTSLHAS